MGRQSSVPLLEADAPLRFNEVVDILLLGHRNIFECRTEAQVIGAAAALVLRFRLQVCTGYGMDLGALAAKAFVRAIDTAANYVVAGGKRRARQSVFAL